MQNPDSFVTLAFVRFMLDQKVPQWTVETQDQTAFRGCLYKF